MSVASISHIVRRGLGPQRQHRKRHRIRLLPARTGRRPDADASAALRVADQAWQQARLQMLEMVRLAIEARDVGRQRGEHFLALAGAAGGFHEVAIIAKGVELQRAQPLGEPGVDERGLGLGKKDPGVVVDHRRDARKIVAVQGELARGQNFAGCRGGRLRKRHGHAASPVTLGIRLSSATTLIMRSSIGRDADHERSRRLRPDIGRRLNLVGRHGDDVGDRVDQQTDHLPAGLSDDDDVSRARFGGRKAEPLGEIDDRQHDAAQIDDAANEAWRARQAVSPASSRGFRAPT